MGSLDLETAKEILGIDQNDPGEDLLQDAYEEACFEVRQKALMNIGVPRLMKKRFEALESAHEAYKAFGGEVEGSIAKPACDSVLSFEEATEVLGTPPPWTSCIRKYEDRMGPAQLEVANSFTAIPLARGIEKMLYIQRAYHAILHSGFEPIFLDPEHYPLAQKRIDQEVKASQRSYSADLLKDFRALEDRGIGHGDIKRSSEDLERCLEQGEELEEAALKRILTEAYRIHQLIQLDKKAKKR